MALAQRPKVDRLVLTLQSTEYPYTFPRAIASFDMQVRQSVDVRLATTAGGTSLEPYLTLKSDRVYYKDIPVEHREFTYYFLDPSNAGTVIEFMLWEEIGA